MWWSVFQPIIYASPSEWFNMQWQYRVLKVFEVGWFLRIALHLATPIQFYFLQDLAMFLENDIILICSFLAAVTCRLVAEYIFYNLSEEDTIQWQQWTVDNQKAMIEANPQLASLLSWRDSTTWKSNSLNLISLLRFGTLPNRERLRKCPPLKGFIINATVVRAQMFATSIMTNSFTIGCLIPGLAFTIRFQFIIAGERIFQATFIEWILRLLDTTFYCWHIAIMAKLIEFFLLSFVYQHCLLTNLNKSFLQSFQIFAKKFKNLQISFLALHYLYYHQKILLFVFRFDRHITLPVFTYVFYSSMPSSAFIISSQFFNFKIVVVVVVGIFSFLFFIFLFVFTVFSKLFHRCVPCFPLVQPRLRDSISLKWKWSSYYEVLNSHKPIGYRIGLIGVIKKRSILELLLVHVAYVLFFVKFIKGLNYQQSLAETFFG